MNIDQKPKQSFVNTILPIAGMIILIVILTKIGLPSWAAIGGPIVLFAIYGGIKQSIDTKNARAHFSSDIAGGQNLSRITTTRQLSIIKIDDKELFTDKVDIAAGSYTLSLRHERLVAASVVSTNFYNIEIEAQPNHELNIGWHYTDDNYASETANKIELDFSYGPLV
jgi:hypothetical protein